MKKIIYLAIFSSLFAMTGCPESTMDENIWLINQSNEKVFFCLSIWEHSNPCPSVSLPLEKGGCVIDINQKGKIGIVGFIPACDSIKIFVLSVDTVNTYPWEQIRAENNILKRYDLTYKTLEKNNWTVTFP